MQATRAIIVTISAALLVMGFAGCLENKTTAYHVYATKGSFATGWAYGGGAAALPFAGDAFLDVNDVDNTGGFIAKGKVAGAQWEVFFEDFAQAPNKPFQDGGIAANFHEHGASGVGDMSIPEVDLEMAGWGLATVKTGGAAYKDPVSGGAQWTAHFMVVRNGVRDNATGAIWHDENKTTAYDPAMPDMGVTVPGDYELHLVLKNQTGNATAATNFGPVSFTPPMTPSAMYNGGTKPLFTNGVVGSQVSVDLSVTSTAVSVTNITFSIKSPSGAEVLRRGLGPGGMMPASQTAVYNAKVSFVAGEVGDYTVTATGRMAPNGAASVKGTVTPPGAIVYNFWWEDLIFGEEAEMKAEQTGILEGSRLHGEHGHDASTAPTTTGNQTRRMRL